MTKIALQLVNIKGPVIIYGGSQGGGGKKKGGPYVQLNY